MKKWIFAIALTASVAIASQSHRHDELCSGFVPKNNVKRHIGFTSLQGGISEADFNSVLDRIQDMYGDLLSKRGAELKINRLWSDATVNASAQQSGKTWIINMYGGLARHETINLEGFALVACHEMGHHMGGAPKMGSWNPWATNEGGADYFSTLKCLRQFFEHDDNEAVLAGKELDPISVTECQAMHSSRAEQLLCIRGTIGGKSVAKLFQVLSRDQTDYRLDTPDPSEVPRTNDRHPRGQCRLDTYFQGALCPVSVSDELSDKDYKIGTCADKIKFAKGLRPRCWFKPTDDTTTPAPAPQPDPETDEDEISSEVF